MGVDQVDPPQVPAGIAHRGPLQGPVAGGDFKAGPVQAQGTVAAALDARHLNAEGLPQGLAAGALAPGLGAVDEAVERCAAGLRVLGAVVFPLDPGLGGGIEQVQRQFRLAVEHRHQAALDARPEHLLLGVLVGAVGQGGLVQDAQAGQPAGELAGQHGGAVVRHQCARQAPLLQCLAEAVRQGFRGLVEIPLGMAGEAGMVVEDAEQHRLQPAPVAAQHLARAMVEIEVPQGVDVGDLEAAHLELLAARLRGQCAVGAAHRARLAQQAAFPHVAADGGVGRQAAACGCGQVVVVQLERPLRVGLVLPRDGLCHLRRQGAGAPGVGARAGAQHGDRVGVGADGVEPALQGGKAKAHRQAGGGVAPGFGGQRGEFAVQLARLGRGGQQVADDRKAQARPTVAE